MGSELVTPIGQPNWIPNTQYHTVPVRSEPKEEPKKCLNKPHQSGQKSNQSSRTKTQSQSEQKSNQKSQTKSHTSQREQKSNQTSQSNKTLSHEDIKNLNKHTKDQVSIENKSGSSQNLELLNKIKCLKQSLKDNAKKVQEPNGALAPTSNETNICSNQTQNVNSKIMQSTEHSLFSSRNRIQPRRSAKKNSSSENNGKPKPENEARNEAASQDRVKSSRSSGVKFAYESSSNHVESEKSLSSSQIEIVKSSPLCQIEMENSSSKEVESEKEPSTSREELVETSPSNQVVIVKLSSFNKVETVEESGSSEIGIITSSHSSKTSEIGTVKTPSSNEVELVKASSRVQPAIGSSALSRTLLSKKFRILAAAGENRTPFLAQEISLLSKRKSSSEVETVPSPPLLNEQDTRISDSNGPKNSLSNSSRIEQFSNHSEILVRKEPKISFSNDLNLKQSDESQREVIQDNQVIVDIHVYDTTETSSQSEKVTVDNAANEKEDRNSAQLASNHKEETGNSAQLVKNQKEEDGQSVQLENNQKAENGNSAQLVKKQKEGNSNSTLLDEDLILPPSKVNKYLLQYFSSSLLFSSLFFS